MDEKKKEAALKWLQENADKIIKINLGNAYNNTGEVAEVIFSIQTTKENEDKLFGEAFDFTTAGE